MKTPGVRDCTTVGGFSLLSFSRNTYSAFFWISLKDWGERTKPEESYEVIKKTLNQKLSQLPGAIAFAFPPPAIQGIGTSGRVHVHPGGSGGEGHSVSDGECDEIHGGGAAAAGNREH